MKAVHLQKFGKPEKAFALVDVDKPKCPQEGILVKVEGFGLNFADIMARTGLYPDCPPLPAVLGYDVVGIIEEVGQGVSLSYIISHVFQCASKVHRQSARG